MRRRGSATTVNHFGKTHYPAKSCDKTNDNNSCFQIQTTMKKPDEVNEPDFSEYMWMAEDGAEEGLQQQIEEEMELIEQDFLEAMFDELLNEEDERDVYYGPPDHLPNQQVSYSQMQLPKIHSTLNPEAPEFVPRFSAAASS